MGVYIENATYIGGNDVVLTERCFEENVDISTVKGLNINCIPKVTVLPGLHPSHTSTEVCQLNGEYYIKWIGNYYNLQGQKITDFDIVNCTLVTPTEELTLDTSTTTSTSITQAPLINGGNSISNTHNLFLSFNGTNALTITGDNEIDYSNLLSPYLISGYWNELNIYNYSKFIVLNYVAMGDSIGQLFYNNLIINFEYKIEKLS